MKANSLRVKIYGCRGSIPVAGHKFKKIGGNTTCLRIISDYLPPGTALIVDTGSGFLNCSQELLQENINNLYLLYTHWHYDHVMGIMLAPHTFSPQSRLEIYGPEEKGKNIIKIFNQLISPPFFPVNFDSIRHRFHYHSLKNIGVNIIVIHPQGGVIMIKKSTFMEAISHNQQISFPGKKQFDIDSCLIIEMHKTFHPEYTISYKFSERPTNKSFVFLTDHENTSALSADLLRHLDQSDLVIQDCQYSQERYPKAAGYGHASPHYCVDLALKAQIKRLGLTHHDPFASDCEVEKILIEAKTYALACQAENLAKTIFVCKDNLEIKV